MLILGGLALVVLGTAASCIAIPLLLARRTATDRPSRRRLLPFCAYFGGIGLGFLLIEVSQLQRLSIFLGHPTYALSVVLFAVLVFSGIGSLLTERFVQTHRAVSLVAPLAILIGVVTAAGIATPEVIRAADSATTPVRIATAGALLAPLSLAMGMPFAIGMRAALASPGTPTAFLWGINGATSVCASVLGVVIALFVGISAAFWAGAIAYVLALASMLAIVRQGAPAPSAGRPADAVTVNSPL